MIINNYFWELKNPETFIVDGIELAWIPGYEQRYACSKDGKVWRKGWTTIDTLGRTHILYPKWQKSWLNSGYLNVKILGKRKLLHVLVAETWLVKPEGKMVIDHIDRNKLNNNCENLRYLTQYENCQNCARAGIEIGTGERHNPELMKERRKQRRANHPEWQERKNAKYRERYRNDPEFREKENARRRKVKEI